MRTMLEEYEVPADHLHLTHIGRDQELMDEAIAFAKRGAWLGMDTLDEHLPSWLASARAACPWPKRVFARGRELLV